MLKFVQAPVAFLSAAAIRLFPLLAAACVLYFPAYKGILPGYAPVAAGLVIALLLLVNFERVSAAALALRESTLHFLLFGLPAIIQLALIGLFMSEPSYDGLFVYQHAVRLIETGEMDAMTYYPPAQTWWYAAWFSLMEPSPALAQLSHVPLSLGVTWATLRLGINIMPPAAARVSALIVAWYPSFLGYVLTTPYYHYLYTLLTLLMVLGVITCWNNKLSNAVFLAGAAAGLGALTKAVQLIAPLQILAWLVVMACVVAAKDVWIRWRGAFFVFVAGMVVMLTPWVLRNWFVFEDIVPVCTSGGLVLYSANNPESNGLYSHLPDTVVIGSPGEMLAHSRWCSEQAKQFMINETEQFLRLVRIKFIHTWGGEATFTDLINWRGESPWWIKQGFSFVFMAGWSSVVFIWAATAIRMMRRRMRLTAYEVLAGVIILSNAVVYMVFEGGDRHHLPLVPLIILVVVAALSQRRAVDETSAREGAAR